MLVAAVVAHAVICLLDRVELEVVEVVQMLMERLGLLERQIPAVAEAAAAELLVVVEAVLQEQEVQALSFSNTPYLLTQQRLQHLQLQAHGLHLLAYQALNT
jgi:hypothetical protein